MKQFHPLLLCLLLTALSIQQAQACPEVHFSYTLPICAGEPLILDNNTIGCPGLIWTITNTSNSMVVYNQPSTTTAPITVPASLFTPGVIYQIKLADGASSAIKSIVWPDLPTLTPDFTINGNPASAVVACADDQPVVFASNHQITPASGLLNVINVWDFGDGSNSNLDPVSHSYAANGVYTVTLTVYIYSDPDWELCDTLTVTKQVYISDCTSGRICGRKFNDQNNNGVLDLTEQIINMPGWTIRLKDAAGNLIQTTTTSSTGSYCFNNLPPGDYVLCEDNQPGWVQTFPPAPGTHSISLGPDEKRFGVNFGNHKNAQPCTIEAPFDIVQQSGCYVEVNSYIAIGPGTVVLSVDWDFGDGTTATGNSASHYYPTGGTYEICLRVIAIKDGKCCTIETCKEVSVRCPLKPCEIVGDFMYMTNGCTLDFTGQILSSNRDVDIWYWEFGDGTTASGQYATHTFSPGSYNVCLTMISKSGEDCCMDRICKRVNILDCNIDPRSGSLDEGASPAPLPDAELKLFPNPAKEKVSIETTIQGAYQLRIFSLDGHLLFEQQVQEQQFTLGLAKLKLTAGIYVVELSNSEVSTRARLVYF